MKRHTEELNKKKISLKEYQIAEDPAAYVKERALNLNEVNKWQTIRKEKGIVDKMDVDDFYIICAADTLGRLHNKESSKEIVDEIACLKDEQKK